MNMIYAEVIGDPIAHSKSPLIHKFWLDKLGIYGDYRAQHVRPEELGVYLAERRQDPDWRGCNVTVPHKKGIMAHLDGLTPFARKVGAVNMIVVEEGRLVGDNSDVAGILDALPLSAFASNRVSEACLIGSGGAALAALAAFRELGVSSVSLNVRDEEKGKHFLAESGMSGSVGPIDDAHGLTHSPLVVNATILGMAGQACMPDTVLRHIEAARGDMVVFDMVYAPLETELLRAARRRGLRTVDGLEMLVGQAASAFDRFFGAPAPRAFDRELRSLLTS